MVRTALDERLFDESTNQAVRDALPELAVAYFELVTHLGDGPVLVALGILLYWFGSSDRRRDRALLIAIGLGTLAIVSGLKGIFAAPRPDPALLEFAPGTYSGYSFPSAHAMGTAAVYAAFAALATVGTRWQRYTIAGLIIGSVALSRVVVGVHYLGDVLVGVAIGLAFVAIVIRDPDPEPGTLFVFAGVVAIGAFLLGSTEYTTLTIGASIGATLAWSYVSQNPARPLGAAILFLGWLVLPLLFVVQFVGGYVQTFFELHWLLEIVGFAIVTAMALLVPNAAERVNDWPPVEWLQEHLPFTGRTFDPEKVAHLPADD